MIRLVIVLLLSGCFTVATRLVPYFEQRNNQDSAPSVITALLGDSRRMFATHFFEKADAYFHGGLAPSIFDAPMKEEESHMTEEVHAGTTNAVAPAQEEEIPAFLQHPQDWIEKFGRNFFPVTHEHLSDIGKEEEILPWLKLATELDPQRVAPYVTAAYWLRNSMKKPDEAEAFLRQGLRNNPDSFEILLELGRIYRDNRKEPLVAENILQLALQKWHKRDAAGGKPEELVCEEILGELVRLEKQQGDLKQWLYYLEEMKKVSPSKDEIGKQIQEVKAKIGTPNN